MKKFYIIANTMKDPQFRVAEIVRDQLLSLGCECMIRESLHTDPVHKFKYTNPEKVPKDVDCVLVLGGDGTVLQASRDLAERQIPIFGINLGTLGYLAEIGEDQIGEVIPKLVLDEYTIEERMMISGTVFHKGRELMSDIALNDIVIARTGRLRVLDFHITVNGRFLNSYSADGVIVSTPTGSTGYNLSAGGPIVAPVASMILLTPIAPHTLTSRSVILPDSATVKIEIGKRAGDETADATFDGDTNVEMVCADHIEIRKSSRAMQFVKVDQISFLEILRRKMSGA